MPIIMQCADEGFTPRAFEPNSDKHEDGAPDYTCTHCGWMQRSAAHGARELCNLALWHSLEAYQAHAAVARAGGLEVPDVPPRADFATAQA